jgi:hypothetical protein
MDLNSDIFNNNQKLLNRVKGINNYNHNLCWIDCSSKGFGLKAKGGVGVARKIGMDSSLPYLNWNNDPIILSLDADTIVDANYLVSSQACRVVFFRRKILRLYKIFIDFSCMTRH